MDDEAPPALPEPACGRPFEKGRSGNPAGRRAGSRNRATLAAAALLEGEAEALTRKAVELALAADPTALRLCLERILPSCHEQSVRFALPPIESTGDISAAMQAVTSALAAGPITGRGGNGSGGGRHFHRGDRDNQKASVCCRSGADFRILRF